MESEQHPSSSSSSLLLHQHDFSSLVSWPHHWQPESFEITVRYPSISPGSTRRNTEMTQVVPEHVARAKLGGNGGNNPLRKENNSTHSSRPQRSNSATLSTISVTCDTDTSIRSRNTRHDPSPSKKSSAGSNRSPTNNMPASHSTSTLVHVTTNPPPTSFHNHSYRAATAASAASSSSSSMSTSLTTASGMNIIHEKSAIATSVSTTSMPNRSLYKATGGAGGGAVGGSHLAGKALSTKHKTASLDDHPRSTQTRGIGKSVLEHLVFVFPENVRKMLAGPKK